MPFQFSVVSQLSGRFGLCLHPLGEKRLLDHLAGKGSTPPVLVLAENSGFSTDPFLAFGHTGKRLPVVQI